MAELWQAYGSWVLYGLFFLVFLWLHGFMHGHGGHSGHRSARGGDAATSSADGQLDASPHGNHAPDQKSHKHGGGCC